MITFTFIGALLSAIGMFGISQNIFIGITCAVVSPFCIYIALNEYYKLLARIRDLEREVYDIKNKKVFLYEIQKGDKTDA